MFEVTVGSSNFPRRFHPKVLKGLSGFNALSHHWVKTLPKQLTCVAKTLSKNTRVKHASKNTSYRSQLSVDFQNRFKRSWDLLLLKKTRFYQFPTTPTQLPNGFKPTKRNKLHYTTSTHNNSRLTHLNKRVGKTTCTSQQNCKDNQRLLDLSQFLWGFPFLFLFPLV